MDRRLIRVRAYDLETIACGADHQGKELAGLLVLITDQDIGRWLVEGKTLAIFMSSLNKHHLD